MRKIEVIFLNPGDCETTQYDISTALLKLHDYMTQNKIYDVTDLLSRFDIFTKLDINTLREHFNEKELEIINLYRTRNEMLIRGAEFAEITELGEKLDKISDLPTLFSIVRKAIKLELPLRCLGDIKYSYLISKELEKIDDLLKNLEKERIEYREYEATRKEIRRYLALINKKVEDMTEILWR